MIIKTQALTKTALDWAVAKCENIETLKYGCDAPEYSTDWLFSGPIIEREIIGLDWNGIQWEARDYDSQQIMGAGHTPLVAAMRCYVASKIGDEIEIPSEIAA